MELVITTRGDEAAARRIEDFGRRAEQARPLLSQIADELLDIQRERFSRNHGMRREARSTLAKDRQQGRDPRPLRATGALMRSVTQRGAPHQKLKIANDYVVLGTKLYYAQFHQEGKGVPKRRVINVTPRQRSQLVQSILDYILDDE